MTDQEAIDKILTQALNIARLEAGNKAKVHAILKKMERDLSGTLNQSVLTSLGKADVNRLLKEAQERINESFIKASSVVDVPGIAEVVAAATAGALGVPIISMNYLKAVASNVMIEGGPLRAWWSKQEADTAFRFTAAVRQGLVSQETNHQIVKRVLQALDISRRNAASLVQTSVAAVASDARMMTYQQNADVIAGLEWLGTFDARICQQCIPRVGLRWTVTGEPIGHNVAFANPPIHFNDRCLLIPRTKTFGDFKTAQATAGGPTTESFDEFIKRKGKEYQDEIFGPERAELYRRKVITRQQLIDNNGRPLTLAQLKAKYA